MRDNTEVTEDKSNESSFYIFFNVEIYGMIKTYLNPMFNSYSLPELFLVTLPIVILFYLTNKNSKFRIYFYLYYIISIPVILLGLVINYFIIL